MVWYLSENLKKHSKTELFAMFCDTWSVASESMSTLWVVTPKKLLQEHRGFWRVEGMLGRNQLLCQEGSLRALLVKQGQRSIPGTILHKCWEKMSQHMSVQQLDSSSVGGELCLHQCTWKGWAEISSPSSPKHHGWEGSGPQAECTHTHTPCHVLKCFFHPPRKKA